MSTSLAYAQKAVSTLRGSVYDADSHLPLPGATVTLQHTDLGAVANAGGEFRFEQLPVGRYAVQVSFVGYKTMVLPEVLLESGKEQVLSFPLTASDSTLQEALVQVSRSENLNNVQEITMEQTLRFAATYLDPARVATSFAGVAAQNDEANGLVVRGNGPNTTQWRLEGVEIVNPNHHSNAGTFSDRATQSGGGVNILSTQVLGTTNFLSGAYAASYGNALGGIMDMHFRKGNNEKHEFTAQAGIIGIDVAAEGPFSKNGKASYLANYRYSFTGLLGAMGISFGGEDIGFQDLSFSINLPTKKAGEFRIFGMGGTSTNVFKAKEDVNDWEFEKDGYTINYTNKMGAAGITHALPMGKHSGWYSTLAVSGLSSGREGQRLNPADPSDILATETDDVEKTKIAFSTAVNHRFNTHHRVKAGTYITREEDRLAVNGIHGQMEGTVFQPYGTWQWSPGARFRTEIGLHYLHYGFNGKSSLEPRAALRWEIIPRHTVSLSYGIHSQAQTPQVYLSLGSRVSNNNRLLDLTRARHYVAGYEFRFVKNSSLKIDAYYQDLFNVPVSATIPTYSALNLVETSISNALVNKGKGRNIGVEATWNHYLTNDFYMLVAGSLYESRYKGASGNWRSTRFNGNHTLSITGGKEIHTQKNAIWGLNAKILWLGGFRDTPIDEIASAAAGTTVYRVAQSYSISMKDYFRPDIRIYRKKNHAGYSTTLALDIQNVSNTRNEAYSYYDTHQQQLVTRNQLGMIPVVSYRWEF